MGVRGGVREWGSCLIPYHSTVVLPAGADCLAQPRFYRELKFPPPTMPFTSIMRSFLELRVCYRPIKPPKVSGGLKRRRCTAIGHWVYKHALLPPVDCPLHVTWCNFTLCFGRKSFSLSLWQAVIMSNQRNATHLTRDSSEGLQKIAKAIMSSHKSIVISGANISTNAGIPVSCCFASVVHKTNVIRISAPVMGFTRHFENQLATWRTFSMLRHYHTRRMEIPSWKFAPNFEGD